MGRDFSYQRRCPLNVTASKRTTTMGLRASPGAEHSSQLTKPSRFRGTLEAHEAMIRSLSSEPSTVPPEVFRTNQITQVDLELVRRAVDRTRDRATWPLNPI